jgi:hypothetical protein
MDNAETVVVSTLGIKFSILLIKTSGCESIDNLIFSEVSFEISTSGSDLGTSFSIVMLSSF